MATYSVADVVRMENARTNGDRFDKARFLFDEDFSISGDELVQLADEVHLNNHSESGMNAKLWHGDFVDGELRMDDIDIDGVGRLLPVVRLIDPMSSLTRFRSISELEDCIYCNVSLACDRLTSESRTWSVASMLDRTLIIQVV